jgi:hypothetical protein
MEDRKNMPGVDITDFVWKQRTKWDHSFTIHYDRKMVEAFVELFNKSPVGQLASKEIIAYYQKNYGEL